MMSQEMNHRMKILQATVQSIVYQWLRIDEHME